jgi:HD superfamily phosphohydrolase
MSSPGNPDPSKQNARSRYATSGSGSPRRTSMADPIHGLIHFDRNDLSHNLLLAVTNSFAFQRLRRIKQMGLAEFVFPGATHSRFVHSLGSAHLMIQVIEHFNRSAAGRHLLAENYPETDIPLSRLLLLSVLLHDIGHTPLSHTMEDILDLKSQGLLHDQYWNRKILCEDPELLKIWKRFGPQLGETVMKFMGEGAPKHFLAQLVSSQLDMDRLDYLQRDSHFLGVQYGRVEAGRIISNLEIAQLANGDPAVAVREEAVPAIEHYLFGRHQAYKMALHSLDKASEALLKKVLQRFVWVRQQGLDPGEPAPELFQLITDGKQLTTQQFLRMDDYYLWEAINRWACGSEDPLLAELASRMLRHNLLKFIDLSKYNWKGNSIRELTPVYEALVAHYEKRKLSMEFCFEETIVHSKPMYQPKESREPIWIRTSRGQVVDLREVSSFSLSVKPQTNLKHLLFVWDRDALGVLTDALEKHLPGALIPTEEEPSEGWL